MYEGWLDFTPDVRLNCGDSDLRSVDIINDKDEWEYYFKVFELL